MNTLLAVTKERGYLRLRWRLARLFIDRCDRLSNRKSSLLAAYEGQTSSELTSIVQTPLPHLPSLGMFVGCPSAMFQQMAP